MVNPNDLVHRHFDLLLFVAVGWVPLVITASVICRRVRGKHLFLSKPEGLTFSESWTSGRSLHSWWTTLGGARNSLFVGVDRNFVYVLPHFPFSLSFLPELYGLEHVIPRDRIRVVAPEPSIFGKIIRVEFATEAGVVKEFALKLRHTEQFLQAVRDNEQSAP